jgi:uncharacterized protein YndB with AHSA1/START domain
LQHVEVKRVIEAPLQAVWDRYTDHLSWNDWAGLGKVVLDRQGTPAPNGTGCVRAIGPRGFQAFEEVLAFEPPQRMTYRLVKGGLPIKNHLGEVLFSAHDKGTLITWRCQFDSRIPGLGPVFRAFITWLFGAALRGLVRRGL